MMQKKPRPSISALGKIQEAMSRNYWPAAERKAGHASCWDILEGSGRITAWGKLEISPLAYWGCICPASTSDSYWATPILFKKFQGIELRGLLPPCLVEVYLGKLDLQLYHILNLFCNIMANCDCLSCLTKHTTDPMFIVSKKSTKFQTGCQVRCPSILPL